MIHKRTYVWVFLFAFSAFIVSSCSKNAETFSTEDTDTSNNESTQETMTSELDDMATSILDNSTDSGAPNGRTTLTVTDDRLTCDGTTIIFSGVNAEKTAGKVVVTFGPNGCTDKKGNVRKGSIIINWWGGKWFTPGSSLTIALENYSINDVQIAGTRNTTCKSFVASPLTVTWALTAYHTATWPDGTTAIRNINKTRKWEHTATEDKFTISNGNGAVYAADGTNRLGKEYKVSITSPLVYLGSCAKVSKVFIPVRGEKAISFIANNGKTRSLTLDYGDGVCENTYTVTSGTVTKTLTCKNDNN